MAWVEAQVLWRRVGAQPSMPADAPRADMHADRNLRLTVSKAWRCR